MLMIMMNGVDNAVVCEQARQHQSCIITPPLCPYAAPEVHVASSMRTPEQTWHALTDGGRALLSLRRILPTNC